jgi:hypothetical protein
MKDLPLHYFLGIHVHRSTSGFFLQQAKYAKDILDRAGMLNCKSSPTPVGTSPKSSATTGELAHDASFYRSITGTLQYLTLTRPDIAYSVHQVCLHMHTRVIHIGHVSSGFCDTSVAPPAMVCICSVRPTFRFRRTPTPTERVARIRGALQQAIASSSATHSWLGHPSGRQLFHAPVQRRNTAPSQMPPPNAAGFDNCCKSYTSSSTRPASCIVTTSLRFTYRRIQFITGERSTWR